MTAGKKGRGMTRKTKSSGGPPEYKTGHGREGFVLVVVVSLLVALAMLATALFTILSGDIRNAAYYDRAVDALHNADAGAHYIFARVRDDIETGTIDGTNPVPVLAVSYPVPPGLNFDPVTNLVLLADGESYVYTVVGRAGTSRATIQAVLAAVLGDGVTSEIGLFGNELFEVKPNGYVYSYNSSSNQVPTNSTGEAHVGTNEELDCDDDTIDGSVHLGEDESGNPAEFDEEFTTSADVSREDRMDSDPLGVVGGPLADVFAAVAIANDNASAVGGTLNGNVLTIDGDVTLTAGDYYVDEIDIRANKVLTINATNGPVKIYLTGPANMGANSELVVGPPVPSNFRLFSNSSEEIKIFPRYDFVGMIYAPLATVIIQPNGDFYGNVWGNETILRPGSEVYEDVDSLSTWYTDLGLAGAKFRSWKHVR